MSYGKVKDAFWTDKKIVGLSDDAKLLALYFMTGPHRNILGCMRVPDGYLMADLGWPSERLADAIRILSECHFICRDPDGWTLIVNQLRHDPIKVPNHVKAAVAIANEVPLDSVVYQELRVRFKAALDVINMASAWHPHGIAIPEPSPLPEPLPEPKKDIRVNKPLATLGECQDKSIEDAVQAWNALATECGLAKVQRLTEPRERSLRQRLSEVGGMDGWLYALSKIRGSPFLRGKPGPWRADFDFVLQAKSFTKLMEGGYDGQKSAFDRAIENPIGPDDVF